MVESQKEELIKQIAEEVAGGRVSWQGDYLKQLNEHGITFTEVEDEIAKINQEDQTARGRTAREPVLTPEQLFTVPGMVATIAAVVIVYFSADALVKTFSIPHWPTTNGKVTSFFDWTDDTAKNPSPYSKERIATFVCKSLFGDSLFYTYSVETNSTIIRAQGSAKPMILTSCCIR